MGVPLKRDNIAIHQNELIRITKNVAEANSTMKAIPSGVHNLQILLERAFIEGIKSQDDTKKYPLKWTLFGTLLFCSAFWAAIFFIMIK